MQGLGLRPLLCSSCVFRGSPERSFLIVLQNGYTRQRSWASPYFYSTYVLSTNPQYCSPIQTTPAHSKPTMPAQTHAEKQLMRAAKKGDLARKSVHHAEDRVVQALEGVARAKEERDRAECKISRARVNLDEEHRRRDQENASRDQENGRTESRQEATEPRPQPPDSSRRKTHEPTCIVRHWYPDSVFIATVIPDRWPTRLNSNKPAKTYDEAGASLDQFEVHGYPAHIPQPPRHNRRPHSPSLRNTADQTQIGQAGQPPHTVEERRPSHADQRSSYNTKPDYHKPTIGGTSRGVASTKEPPSHHQRQAPRGRRPTRETCTATSFEPNMSNAPESLSSPISAQRPRPATVMSSFQRPPDMPVSEVPRSQPRQQTGSSNSQQANLGAYNTTRRRSLHRESDIIHPSNRSATTTVKSSQGTGALHQTPTVSRASKVTTNTPLLSSSRNTQPSTGPSTLHSTKQKPRGPRRKKDTLGMSFDSGLGGGW
jgi:hypothetical protein